MDEYQVKDEYKGLILDVTRDEETGMGKVTMPDGHTQFLYSSGTNVVGIPERVRVAHVHHDTRSYILVREV